MFDRSRCSLALAAVMATTSPALADKEVPPRSYKKVAPGGEYVFVMLPSGTEEDEVWHQSEKITAGIREIRRAYTQSGMYRNDGSREPLWTVDWYANSVDVASDGVHLIRHGPWARLPRDRHGPLGPALDQVALSFFASGRLLRSYRIRELVSDPKRLERSASHFEWRPEGRFDDGRMEYTLATTDGNRFVFDVRTGSIVSDSRAPLGTAWGWWWLAGGMAVGAVGLLVLWRWTRTRMQKPKACPADVRIEVDA